MAKLVDYVPDVIYDVQQAGEINQTALTEKVWGTSGRGNTSLTQKLFPAMVAHGWLTQRKAGRSILFSVTPKGVAKMEAMCKERGYTVPQGRTPMAFSL